MTDTTKKLRCLADVERSDHNIDMMISTETTEICTECGRPKDDICHNPSGENYLIVCYHYVDKCLQCGYPVVGEGECEGEFCNARCYNNWSGDVECD